MKSVFLMLRVGGYTLLGIFTIQIINLYTEWFPISERMIMIPLFSGLGLLFILVLLDKWYNPEDKYYSKNVEK